MDIEAIVEHFENVYEVWSDGVSGSVLEAQKNLADLETLSIQTAKKIIREPTQLRIGCSKSGAEDELCTFEETGIKCTIIHVGPKLLNQYSNTEIEKFLNEEAGGVNSVFIKSTQSGSYVLFSNMGQIFIDLDETDYYFYLACLRYLAQKGRIEI